MRTDGVAQVAERLPSNEVLSSNLKKENRMTVISGNKARFIAEERS
jgi:hypothetical protein